MRKTKRAHFKKHRNGRYSMKFSSSFPLACPSSFLFLFLFLPFSLAFLKISQPKIYLKVWESVVSSPAGSIQAKLNSAQFRNKILHLVATISIIYIFETRIIN